MIKQLFTTLSSCLLLGTTASALTISQVGNVGTAIYPDMIQKGVVYGVMPTGGTSGNGALFSYTVSTGILTILASFNGGIGGSYPNPGSYVLANGDIVGTFRLAGDPTYNAGGVFYYTAATKTIASIHNFKSDAGGKAKPIDGATPIWGLLPFGNNTLYGTASEGGHAPGDGEIFKVNTKTQTVSSSFFLGANQVNGHIAYSGLANVQNTIQLGTTLGFNFGKDKFGTIYAYYPSRKSMNTIYQFTNGTDGEWPQVTPLIANSLFYVVTTFKNEQLFAGAILNGNPNQTGASLVHSMNGGTDGYSLNTPLIYSKNLNIYGVATYGGDQSGSTSNNPVGDGTLFSLNTQNQFSVVTNFGGAMGSNPTTIVEIATGVFIIGTQTGVLNMITVP